jgi:hypothetical protein
MEQDGGWKPPLQEIIEREEDAMSVFVSSKRDLRSEMAARTAERPQPGEARRAEGRFRAMRKPLRVLSALRKTRGILMICKKKGLRVLSALRKTRWFLMIFSERAAARVECLEDSKRLWRSERARERCPTVCNPAEKLAERSRGGGEVLAFAGGLAGRVGDRLEHVDDALTDRACGVQLSARDGNGDLLLQQSLLSARDATGGIRRTHGPAPKQVWNAAAEWKTNAAMWTSLFWKYRHDVSTSSAKPMRGKV